jgi:hypothetical protein
MAGLHRRSRKKTKLIKALAGTRKIFLTLLARYWLKLCCQEDSHHMNFKASGYLPALGSNIFHLRDYIWDALFTKRTSNYRVLCWASVPTSGMRMPGKSVVSGVQTRSTPVKIPTRFLAPQLRTT